MKLLISALLLASASGCAYDQYLPPETVSKTPVQSSFQFMPQHSQQSGTEATVTPSPYYKNLAYQLITVKGGDTLSKIAGRYDIPTPSLIELNRSRPPYVIHVGEQIKVPYFRIHRVRGGETLYAISKVYGVSLAEMVHFNKIAPPYRLRPAMALRIPQRGGGELRVASVDAKTWPVTRAVPLYEKEEIVVVRPQPRKSNKDLTVNKLTKPNSATTKEGKNSANVKSGPVTTIPERKAEPKTAAEVVVLGGDKIAKVDLPPFPRNRYSIKHPPNRSGKIFGWPVKGKLLSGYGKKKNGLHNDGINISVASGVSIKAAENGIVSYVGNEMRSFGNLILISHADGYVTTYGHTSKILVGKGDIVRKGDVIAYVGSTGDVQTAQLHFEIRKEGTALNPSVLLSDR